MYELADWGRPMAPEWAQPMERIDARLPGSLIRLLRRRARGEGVSISALMTRLLTEALGVKGGGSREDGAFD
jgi:hypothetical protein